MSDKEFANTPIVIKYQTLFKNLNLSHIKDHNNGEGCSGYSTHSMIKAIIVKTLEWIPSIPDSSQFYRFLKKFHSSKIEKLIANINNDTLKLLGKKIKTAIIDSKPIKTNTKKIIQRISIWRTSQLKNAVYVSVEYNPKQ